MNWNNLTQESQIEEIKSVSEHKPVLIFKHSTRCSISSMSLDRVRRNWKDGDDEKISVYYLDLIADRKLSDFVANEFGVSHESPQVILIKNGSAVYNKSHYDISYPDIMSKI
jgi:bacillithiol system protein YtxJ